MQFRDQKIYILDFHGTGKSLLYSCNIKRNARDNKQVRFHRYHPKGLKWQQNLAAVRSKVCSNTVQRREIENFSSVPQMQPAKTTSLLNHEIGCKISDWKKEKSRRRRVLSSSYSRQYRQVSKCMPKLIMAKEAYKIWVRLFPPRSRYIDIREVSYCLGRAQAK